MMGYPIMLPGWQDIALEIDDERTRQDEKWGVQMHSDERWLTILAEEVGEAAEAVLKNGKDKNLESELVQVAAVCVAWLKCIERRIARQESEKRLIEEAGTHMGAEEA